jgi:hypothetical protein
MVRDLCRVRFRVPIDVLVAQGQDAVDEELRPLAGFEVVAEGVRVGPFLIQSIMYARARSRNNQMVTAFGCSLVKINDRAVS